MKLLLSPFLVFIISLLLYNCHHEGGSSNGSSSDSTMIQDSIPVLTRTESIQLEKDSSKKEDFNTFYDRFMTDSMFQMQRTQFPLPTFNTDSFTVHDGNIAYKNYYTKSTEWNLLRSVELNKYKHQYAIYSDSLVAEEIIFEENSGFKDMMKYQNIHGMWFLVKHEMYNL